MKFIVYDMIGKMLRQVSCPSNLRYLQARDGEFVMEGIANDTTQKIKFDGLDEEGQPINPRIVNKTPEEIEAEKPPEPKSILIEKQSANITNEQLQNILDRLDDLEK